MEITSWLLILIFVIDLVALLGFFYTKNKGFGRFTTSTFLLLLVVILSGLLYAGNKLDSQVLVYIFFAVIGFAGGLFTNKDSTNLSTKAETEQ